jgi:tricorn protease
MHKFALFALHTVVLSTLLVSVSVSQDSALWLRSPAISPDGQTILFCYKGDIYSVPSSGGTATPRTIRESYECSPVWSHDGKTIAFASDRYGNFDVFVMPASGGEAKRLTFHSTSEMPSTFSADDKAVYFSGARQPVVTDVQFPTQMMGQLFSVPVTGGPISLVLPVPALNATVNSSGNSLVYHDIKGYESPWRKHHHSSVTRDIWLYDFPSKKYTQLTSFAGEDRNPVFDTNDSVYYYLSEEGGSFNIVKSSLANPSRTTALTHFAKNPVRFLTRSNDNTLCFGYDGGIYILHPGGQPKEISVRLAQDGRSTIDKIVPVNEGFTELSLSPNGKEFAYVFRGEIFVTSMEGGMTKRITNTSWQERTVSFSPDGRSLVYTAEKDSSWNVYRTSVVRKEEPYFFMSTILKEEPVVATSAEEYQPHIAPDGKEVAYLENRVTLKVINLETRKIRTIMTADKNYSYADGDQYYQWSPDGKWFLVQFGLPDRVMNPEVGLVSAAGDSVIHDLTHSGFSNVVPRWSMDGKMVVWGCDREGKREQSGQAATLDVYGMYLTRDVFDRSKLSKEEFALLKEQDDKAEKEKKEAEAKNKKSKTESESSAKSDTSMKPVVIDWKNLTERKKRLTINTSDLSDWLLSKDGEKLFYLTSFDKGYDLWVTETRTRETKSLAKLGINRGSMELSSDGKFILLLADGKPMKIEVENGKSEPVKLGGEMVLKQADERAYIFDHCWRQFKEKFYVEDLQGVDWDYYKSVYQKFLPSINNNYDFAEMLSEMLGEVNASHTGCYYYGGAPNTDETGSLGIFLDYTYAGIGMKVAEVVEGGPLDRASSKVQAGHVIEKIDGEPVSEDNDWYVMLNRRVRKLTLLSMFDPSTGTRWEESVKPITTGEEGELLYKRWVRNRRNEVDRISQGKIGYIHVRGMNDGSMRTTFEEALGRNLGKQAIIIDTRFNGGGNLHEQLSDFLGGKKYFDIIPHGQYVGSEPYDKWVKPSIVLIGESNYSDAHLFPVEYKLKGIGKTLGMPVPGTGTFVWWESQIDPTLVFGIPMGGWKTLDGKFCENNQLEPDIKIRLEPAISTAGRDQQIEAAVNELLGATRVTQK